MKKEIFEQPAVIGDTLQAHVQSGDAQRASAGAALRSRRRSPGHHHRLRHLLSCRPGREILARADRAPPGRGRYRLGVPLPRAATCRRAASRSSSRSRGETADTLAALRYAKAQGQHIVAVVNQPESTMAREADAVLATHAGPEIGVASTKAFTTQLVVLACLAIALARARGKIDAAREAALSTALTEVPARASEVLEPRRAHRADRRSDLAEARDVLYLGRGTAYPLALEGALKLKEISYIHAEGYAAGEMKHGPIALIDDERADRRAGARATSCSRRRCRTCRRCWRAAAACVMISDREGLARLDGQLAYAHRGAALRPVRRAAALRDPGAAPRLSRRRHQGHRRRPAAQPREERDGGVGGGRRDLSCDGRCLLTRLACARHPLLPKGRRGKGRRAASVSTTTVLDSLTPQPHPERCARRARGRRTQ